jgi:NAD(P)-dependent dehydrogenase (short-subunit alcohol dehydrogenase family)
MTRALADSVALVTGGGTGIGAAITEALADAGARVMIAQRTDADARDAVERLAVTGRTVAGVGGDLSQPQGCANAVAACVETFGRIDILVNCAALTGPNAIAGILDADDAHIDGLVDLNLKAPARCLREAARRIRDHGEGGVIVNISSVAAHAAQELAAIYAATKGGLEALTRGAALELAPLGIRVVAVAPGDIETVTSQRIVDETRERGGSGRYHFVTPLGRRGSPTEIGAAVRFLCSPEASFITGTTLVVDGGFLAY